MDQWTIKLETLARMMRWDDEKVKYLIDSHQIPVKTIAGVRYTDTYSYSYFANRRKHVTVNDF